MPFAFVQYTVSILPSNLHEQELRFSHRRSRTISGDITWNSTARTVGASIDSGV